MTAALLYLSFSSFAIGIIVGLFLPVDFWGWWYDDQPHDLGGSWSAETLEPLGTVLERSWNDAPVRLITRPYDWERDL